jgi:hypothetical protein
MKYLCSGKVIIESGELISGRGGAAELHLQKPPETPKPPQNQN